jgi:hypothetical protein
VQIVLATTNRAKVQALAERVGPRVSIMPLPHQPPERHIPSDLETGTGARAIAWLKAQWYSRHIPTQYISATDGTLLVPALGTEWVPAATSRFAGSQSDGAGRAEALLERAQDLIGPERLIGWTEALAIAREGEVLANWDAHSPPGELATDMSDDFDPIAGFWVPYVWRCPEYGGRRLSELTEHERLARRDHWAILGEELNEWALHQPRNLT